MNPRPVAPEGRQRNLARSEITSMMPVPRTALVFAALLAGSTAAHAEKHALLIGIGSYPPPIRSLDGPPHDVDALRRRLVEGWGFDATHVATLIDAEATRAAILARLDRLAAVTRPGDHVFLYYSGHGTSAYDEDLRFASAELGKWTGGLVPWDYGGGATAPRLIVGRRDLRPRLAELDRDREVFVVFDTCFAGNSVRSLSSRPARWADSTALGRAPARGITRADDPFDVDPIFGAATARRQTYPYRRLIYLAAARKFERAEDLLPSETRDGRPHGALTDALLQGLRGSADGDGDQRLSYDELYRYVHDEVRKTTEQMPQLLYPESRPELTRRSIFGHPGLPVPAPGARETGARELVDLTYPRQHFALSLELSGGAHHLLRGQRFGVTARVDSPAVLLLLNVDETGTVSVLYPLRERQLGPTTGLHETYQAVAPYGTEYLKLFAFERAPQALSRWLGLTLDAGDPELDELVAFLRRPGVDVAQTRLEVLTAGERGSR